MDSIDFAVLTKVQDLVERFGLRPYDIVATLDHSMDEPVVGMGVRFQIMADDARTNAEHTRIERQGKKLLDSLGIANGGTLGGGEIAVIDALDAALHKSPKLTVKR